MAECSNTGLQNKNEIFWLSVSTFKDICMISGTEKGKQYRKYYIQLESIFHDYIKNLQTIKFENERKLLMDNLEKEKQKLIEKAELEKKLLIEDAEREKQFLTKFYENKLKENNKIPRLYIFQNDINDINSHKKIGYSESTTERVSPYRAVLPNGRTIFTVEVQLIKKDLEKTEKFLHVLLTEAGTRVAGESFDIPTEQAKLWLLHISNTVKIAQNKDYGILKYLVEKEEALLHHQIVERDELYIDGWSQTNESDIKDDFENILYDEPIPDDSASTSTTSLPKISQFNKFVDECCELHPTFEVSSGDICGRYRIWAQYNDKETYHAFLDYCKKRFTPGRLKIQNKIQVVNGFKGVQLIPFDLTLSLVPSIPERFIFQMCERGPGYKMLQKQLLDEYGKWLKRNNIEITDNLYDELHLYLKTDKKRVYKTLVWTQYGKGTGYEGFCLKEDKDYYRHPSTTSKAVEKVDLVSEVVLDTWPSIAKAAEREKISPALLSRQISNKVIINNSYYYRAKI